MMEDRFKFRAWVPSRRAIFPVTDILRDRLIVEKDYFDNVGDTLKLDLIYGVADFELIQCTGLKDKKGTLIFEGDIVDMIPLDTEVTSGVVIFKDSRASFVVKEMGINKYYDCQMFFDLPILHKIEVIGNKYENPELLEDA